MENPILKSAQFAINYIVVPIHSKGVHVYTCWVMFPVHSQMVFGSCLPLQMYELDPLYTVL